MLVTHQPYSCQFVLCVKATCRDLPPGYNGNLIGTVLQHWGPCFGIQVNFFGCRNYRTGKQGTKTIVYRSGRVVLTAGEATDL